MKCKLKMHLICTTCEYKYCFEMRALSAGVLRALTIALRRPLGCFPIPHSTCSGMVALIWQVPHNSGDVGTHADNPSAGFAFAVPFCNCTFAKRNPQLIFDRSTVSTFDFGAKAWPSAIQKFEVGRCPDTSRRMPVPISTGRRQLSASEVVRRPAEGSRVVRRDKGPQPAATRNRPSMPSSSTWALRELPLLLMDTSLAAVMRSSSVPVVK